MPLTGPTWLTGFPCPHCMFATPEGTEVLHQAAVYVCGRNATVDFSSSKSALNFFSFCTNSEISSFCVS